MILVLLGHLDLQEEQDVKVQQVNQELKAIQVSLVRWDVLDLPEARVIKVCKDHVEVLELKERGVEMVTMVPRVVQVEGDPQAPLDKMVLMEHLVARELLEIKVKLEHLV